MVRQVSSFSQQMTANVWLLWDRYRSLISYAVAVLIGLLLGGIYLVDPRLAPVAVVGVIGGILALQRPILLCHATILVTAVGSGLKRGRLIPIITLNELLVIISVGVIAVYLLTHKHKLGNFLIEGSQYGIKAAYLYVGGTFVIPAAIYLLQGVNLNLDNAFKMAGPVQYMLVFAIYAFIPRQEKQKRRLIYSMMLGAAIVALVGLLQAADVGVVERIIASWYPSSHAERAEEVGRVTSLMGGWNALGIMMMFTIILGWTMFPAVPSYEGRTLIGGVLILSILCLLISGSFAGTICTVIGIVLIEVMEKRTLRIVPFVIGVVGVGALATLLLPTLIQPLVEQRLAMQFSGGSWVPQTLRQRFMLWNDIFIPAIRRHFPYGVYPVVPHTFIWRTVESQYLGLLFRTGLVGLLGHLAWISMTLVWVYRMYRRSSGFQRALAQATFVILINLSIAGFTNSVFTYAGSIDYMWMLLAFLSSYEVLADHRRGVR